MQAQVVPNAAAPDVAGKAPDEIAPEDALSVDGATVTSATPDQALIVPTEPVVDEDNRSALDKILSSPMLMGLIGGGALLVLLLLVFMSLECSSDGDRRRIVRRRVTRARSCPLRLWAYP